MENSSLNISIKNVTKKYDEFYALKDISLDITSGEFMTYLAHRAQENNITDGFSGFY